jgi:hypothetical protein
MLKTFITIVSETMASCEASVAWIFFLNAEVFVVKPGVRLLSGCPNFTCAIEGDFVAFVRGSVEQ